MYTVLWHIASPAVVLQSSHKMELSEQSRHSSDTKMTSGDIEQIEESPPPAYDDVLREIGEFGLYQLLVGLIVGFVFAYGSFITMNFIFAVDIIEHR